GRPQRHAGLRVVQPAVRGGPARKPGLEAPARPPGEVPGDGAGRGSRSGAGAARATAEGAVQVTPPQGWTRQLLEGLGQFLEDAGAGDWNPEGVYTAAQTAITLGGLPTTPDLAISLATYGLGQAGDDIEQTDSSVLVQFRMRGGPDPRVADD